MNKFTAKLSEETPTNPVNKYGVQKVEAESLVLKSDKCNLVIRTSVSTHDSIL